MEQVQLQTSVHTASKPLAELYVAPDHCVESKEIYIETEN